MDDFNIGKFLPEFSRFLDGMDMFVRVCVMAGPLALLGLGLYFLLAAPKEANHTAGYRFRYGMAKVRSWQFMQFLAGSVYSVTGLILTVVMGCLCVSIHKLDLMSMSIAAIKMIGWQVAVIVAVTVGINVTVMVLFDSEGNRRSDFKGIKL